MKVSHRRVSYLHAERAYLIITNIYFVFSLNETSFLFFIFLVLDTYECVCSNRNALNCEDNLDKFCKCEQAVVEDKKEAAARTHRGPSRANSKTLSSVWVSRTSDAFPLLSESVLSENFFFRCTSSQLRTSGEAQGNFQTSGE